MTPVSCFITFETEEGFQRALTMNSIKSDVRILGEKVHIEEGTEPTNVIWENR